MKIEMKKLPAKAITISLHLDNGETEGTYFRLEKPISEIHLTLIEHYINFLLSGDGRL